MSQAIGWPMDRALAGANGYRQDVSYDLGYNADELREIFRLIDWMMQLRADLSAKFEEELVTLEEVLSMPYVTSVERIAEARGEVKGGAGVLLTQLNTLCGPVPAELEEHVRHLPFDRLEALAKAVLDFRGLEDVQAWLDAHGGLGE